MNQSLTPSAGIFCQHHDKAENCLECGKPMASRLIFGKGIEFRCINFACARCPFKRENVDTSFSRLGH